MMNIVNLTVEAIVIVTLFQPWHSMATQWRLDLYSHKEYRKITIGYSAPSNTHLQNEIGITRYKIRGHNPFTIKQSFFS